ncbi:substrate-binding domain-containing protein, partial [Planctomycetota bacterium]
MSSRRIALRFPRRAMADYLRRILHGIQRYAEQAAHWRCVLDPLAGSGDHVDYDGVIAPDSRPVRDRLQEAGVPAAFVGSHAIFTPMPRVAENRFRAGTLVARHLVERDYTHFGYVGFIRQGASRKLEYGYQRAVSSRGRSSDFIVIAKSSAAKAACWSRHREILSEWLDGLRPPAGILCISDSLAHLVADAALAKGLRIPDDVGIVGAGNDPLYCNWPACPLTSVGG